MLITHSSSSLLIRTIHNQVTIITIVIRLLVMISNSFFFKEIFMFLKQSFIILSYNIIKSCFLSITPSSALATLQRSVRMYNPVGNLADNYDENDDPSCYHWCCHPCHSGREWYSISQAGCLRQLCLILILLLLVATCGWQCGCCAATILCCYCTCEWMEELNDD